MQLFYDPRDGKVFEREFFWLDDLGARPLSEANPQEVGFLFAGARSIDDYGQLVKPFPNMLDRPEARAPLLRLDMTLQVLDHAGVQIPQPKTWYLELDQEPPPDIQFPVFVRMAKTSWKLGGQISRVRNRRELMDEASGLRRVMGWDECILAREWLNLAVAGTGFRILQSFFAPAT